MAEPRILPAPRTAHRSVPDAPVDDLLAVTARRYPTRTALRASYADITYAELDAAVTSCAAALRGLLGPRRTTVAIAATLHPDFVVGFYGAIRSGNVAVPVNPMMAPHCLAQQLTGARVRFAFVTTELFAQLRTIRHMLPDLAEAALVGPGPVSDANDIRTIDDLSAAYEVRGNALPAAVPLSARDIACVQFTGGTTGTPRGVLSTHRNLTVNAAQVAEAHELTDAVLLNNLPKFHLMHLNAAVYAAATQVLCTAADPVDAVAAANASGATHFYTIPPRLHRLAADERLDTLALDTVRVIASGGSALAPHAGAQLAAHFGVPVIQGYGLAETSPLTHSAPPYDPRPGSVGPVVAGTECRIVDPASRRELPSGHRGEIQLRGPQVMHGYLDHTEPSGVDSAGWLSTGDIGYQDDDGYLFVVDRIKDLFKCDNHLVSPVEIEHVLAAHPRVRECAVVDYPDPISVRVPYAVVAATDGTVPTGATAEQARAELIAFAAERLPAYESIRHVEFVRLLPRSPNGKVVRRDLRAELITRRELSAPGRPVPIRKGISHMPEQDLSNLIAVIARFETKGDPERFERFFLEHVEFMRRQPGFGSHQAVRLADDPSVYVNFGWWVSAADFQATNQSETFRDHQAQMRQMLRGAEVDVCKNLYRVNADESAGARDDFGTPLMTVTTYRLTGSAEEFETAFAAHAAHIRAMRGFGYADLNRSLGSEGVYHGIGYWWDPAAQPVAAAHETYAALEKLAEVTAEKVTHVAWNRAADAEEPTDGKAAGQ